MAFHWWSRSGQCGGSVFLEELLRGEGKRDCERERERESV